MILTYYIIIYVVLRHHPDIVGQSPKTLEYFRTIQDGYKILSTPELRREYDAVSGIAKTASAPSLVAEAEATAYHAVPKMHYEGSTFLRADKRWQMYVQKYKSENWKKIPLADRKVNWTLIDFFFSLIYMYVFHL
jgi:curved DNA-binding protein CbpA